MCARSTFHESALGAEGGLYDSYWLDGICGWKVEATMPAPLAALLTSIAHNKSVLDFGGGDGLRYGRLLRDVAGRYVVSDVSKAVLHLRRSQGDEAIHVSDLEQSPMRFDVIVALEVLEHLLDPEEALAVLVNKLAPGGTLLMSVPNAFSLVNRLRMLRGRLPASGVGGSGVRGHTYRAPHIRFFDLASLLSLIKGSGLQIDELFGAGIDAWKLTRFVHFGMYRYNGRLGTPFRLLSSGFVVRCSTGVAGNGTTDSS